MKTCLRRGILRGFGKTADVLSPEMLCDIYGLDCRLIDVDNGRFTAVYPVLPIKDRSAVS